MEDHDPLIDSILGITQERYTGQEELDTDFGKDGQRNTHRQVDQKAYRHKASVRHLRQMQREVAAAEQLDPLPEAGHEIILLMTGNFHGMDLITAVLRLAETATCEHLRLATLGINRIQSQQVADMIDAGMVGQFTILISEMFEEKNIPEVNTLRLLMDERKPRTSVIVNRNHCKLATFAMSDGRRFAMHGSSNLRRCNSIEQMALSHDAGLHDFFANYIDTAAEARS